jgi:GTP-binding protein HflX
MGKKAVLCPKIRSHLKTTNQKKTLVVCISTACSKENSWHHCREFFLLCSSFNLDLCQAYLCRVKDEKKIASDFLVAQLLEHKRSLSFTHIAFGSALNPKCHQKLSQALGCTIIDRTELLLGIFEKRAQSSTGKLQVALAKVDYELSKLIRAWTHLERQRGGIGLRGGPGEKQIEIDRRLLRKRRDILLQRLKHSQKTRELHLKRRMQTSRPTIALIGYTNAGKTTLFQRLTGSQPIGEDMLFATLDPLSRKMKCAHEIILTDTVGFIQDMPAVLEQTFHDTLIELRCAHLILHVVDASDSDMPLKMHAVEQALDKLVSNDTPVWIIANKTDVCSFADSLLERSSQAVYPISASSGQGVFELLQDIVDWAITTQFTRNYQGLQLASYKKVVDDDERLG